jgi:hypothetical protein
MNTYEVQFKFNGRIYRELVSTTDGIKARELIKGRYPGSVILSARKK